jgi:TDG/mug DNA glycosylase family protein
VSVCYLAKVTALSDFLRPGLDLVFVGINPGVRSAAAGHHYAGPSNLFWPLLYESGLVTEPLTFRDDERVLEWGIGLTNMVARSSPGLADLSLEELRAGAASVRRKLRRYQPAFACFNGKRIFEVFAVRPCEMGLQPERVGVTQLYVMPSTSPRGASYQRADKLRFFRDLAGLVSAHRRERVAS